MASDAFEPGAPLWWVGKLERMLDRDQPVLKKYDDYYEGQHPLGFATPKFREAFGSLFSAFSDNWCDLVVDAVRERLRVQGFRWGGQDAAGDAEAWRIWQANQLDAESAIAHTEALVHGRAYALVWVDEDDEQTPRIWIEHPSQVVVAHAAGNRRQRLAALKRWTDDDGYGRATLFLPDAIYRYRSGSKYGLDSARLNIDFQVVGSGITRWHPVPDEPIIENPFGIVPVVPLSNRRRLLNEGVSEIARIIPIQDGVNKLVADMLVASEFGAAPQRWATGIEVPRDPQTGLPIPMFENLVSRLWASDRDNATFGQFPQTDLRPFVEGIEMLVQHIASQSRTPPHYFYLKGQFPSGESIKSAETGLVSKTNDKKLHFGEPWEEVMRLAMLMTGDVARSRNMSIEVMWADPESRSESEHTDAILKQKTLGIPDEALWEELGRSPQQIERYRMMRTELGGPSSPAEMTFSEKVKVLSEYVKSGFDPAEAAEVLGLPPVAHTGAIEPNLEI